MGNVHVATIGENTYTTSLIRYAKMMEVTCNDIDIKTLLKIDQFSLEGIE